MPTSRTTGRSGSKKGRQQVANERRGKYRKAFVSCVKRTGKWRGKPANLSQAR